MIGRTSTAFDIPILAQSGREATLALQSGPSGGCAKLAGFDRQSDAEVRAGCRISPVSNCTGTVSSLHQSRVIRQDYTKFSIFLGSTILSISTVIIHQAQLYISDFQIKIIFRNDGTAFSSQVCLRFAYRYRINVLRNRRRSHLHCQMAVPESLDAGQACRRSRAADGTGPRPSPYTRQEPLFHGRV